MAFYLDFERVMPYDPSTGMDGKALARAVNFDSTGELESLCRRLGVTPLVNFYYETNSEAFAKIGADVPPDMELDEPQWFPAADGLRSVDALLSCHEASGMDARLLDDLTGMRSTLLVAIEHGCRFRLRLDI